ncbi:tannase/feruloyl esterase family alpha/beta hydrolase [Duganella sp. SAP-35]|uniref:Tannase/feruloyl esterase family alpha/beta hydrolase n=1 Tax=Duganella aceris TaxID=2703883 RepID=A0ABX0FNP5_9BURK|nr:tannase/feruloyl esterase family alpha/beta hydrolase [Duganella aceris]
MRPALHHGQKGRQLAGDIGEQGRAPERIVASRIEAGRLTRTPPLCPYPRQAVYLGTGSSDDAANFVCQIKEKQP